MYTDPWPNNSWQRHLQLTEQSSQYGFECQWDFYVIKGTQGKVIFVHRGTGIEFSQEFDAIQLSHIMYGSRLLRDCHFINWMGGL